MASLHQLAHQINAAENSLKETNNFHLLVNEENGIQVITSNQINMQTKPFQFALIVTPAEKMLMMCPEITGFSQETDVFTCHYKNSGCFQVQLCLPRMLEINYFTLTDDNRIQEIEEHRLSNEAAAIYFQTIQMLKGKTPLDLAFEKLATADLSFILEKTNEEIAKRKKVGVGITQQKSKVVYCIVCATKEGYVLDRATLKKGIMAADQDSLKKLKEKLFARLWILKGNYTAHSFKSGAQRNALDPLDPDSNLRVKSKL
ncbi:MAG: hypothetical protein Q8L78_02695 [Coxiellaceae bacterium]|nr:hypothetical protein [Coxiellaceae bacterium]